MTSAQLAPWIIGGTLVVLFAAPLIALAALVMVPPDPRRFARLRKALRGAARASLVFLPLRLRVARKALGGHFCVRAVPLFSGYEPGTWWCHANTADDCPYCQPKARFVSRWCGGVEEWP